MTWTLAEHTDFHKKMQNGEISAESLKAAYREWLAAESDIVAEINKKTVAQLKEIVGRFTWTTGLKKADLVEKYWDRLGAYFMAASTMDSSVSYSHDAICDGSYKRIIADKYLAVVDATTDEDLSKFAAEHAALVANHEQALSDPQTYEQFARFIKAKGFDALSDAQVARMDAIMYERAKGKIDEERERAAKIDQIDLGDADIEIVKERHTQKDCDIWIAKLSERVDRDKYKELAAAASKLGGHWSRWSGGFLFWREEDANTFAGVTDDDVSAEERREHVRRWREEQAADRLEQYAMRRTDAAMDKLTRERLVNTVRRARMAAGAEDDARQEMAMAATVVSVASVLQEGIGGILRGVRFASDIVTLSAMVGEVQRDYANKHKIRYWDDQPLPEPDDAVIRCAVMPYPWLDRWDANELLEKAKGKRGQSANINLMKSLQNDEGEIRCRNSGQADILLELVKAVRFDAYRVHRHDTYKVLRRLGIQSTPVLRYALREMVPHIVAPQQPDPVLKAERDLIGMKIAGYFPTPHSVVDLMIDNADISEGAHVADTSAGDGNIVERVLERVAGSRVTAIEIDYRLVGVLRLKNQYKWEGRATVVHADSLSIEPLPEFDAVLINPPFEGGQDADHVQHAYKMVKPGGVLVAIVGSGIMTNSTSKAVAFRNWLDEVGGELIEDLSHGTFHESGTGVSAKMLRIYK